jgi:hypothetical protein
MNTMQVKKMEKIVYIVHAVDTEGPLYESLEATFIRLKEIFDIDMKPSYENLDKLRKKEFSLNGKEEVVSKVLDTSLLSYNDSWDKIDNMLANIMSPEFRNKMVDSFGGGWIYNWSCVDHVGYETNPRRRDMGYHNIYDRYIEFIDKYNAYMDSIHWHAHPMSTYKEAHRCATSFENSPHIHQVLCRRILERNYFPSVFSAGFHAERPDCNWFLEQWIPFDYSNISVEVEDEETGLQNDIKQGTMDDWRRAPNDWSIYNPDFYDYQKRGSCKRYIARILNINTRVANISEFEVKKAFRRADQGRPTFMGVTNHDFRNMANEVDFVRNLIDKVSKEFPDVKFKFSEAKEAFNAVVHDGKYEKLQLDIDLYQENGVYNLKVLTRNDEVFGPQPYLAIKTKSGRFIHDNFDFGLDGKSWHYVFNNNTVLGSDLAMVGIAANNIYGDTFIKKIGLN